jgi:hypothetical protein
MSNEQPIDLVPMVQHRLLMDILPFENVKNFWGQFSLVPPSPDVEEILNVESNRRMEKVAPLGPVCEMYIVLTADIITEAMYQRLVQSQDPEDSYAIETARGMRPMMLNQNREVVRAALYPTLAHMIDGGFITLPQPKVAQWDSGQTR